MEKIEVYGKKREIWVDDVKLIACMLVLLGHFFMSMIKPGILPENDLYKWFIKTIYYFHVPLFFICSGYLYQKFSKTDILRSWWKNLTKKALVLGVPYFTFSFATWLLKTVFAGSVNGEANGLFQTFFTAPSSPYWYLYALFFVFLITPTFRNTCTAIIALIIALAMKIIIVVGGGYSVYAVSTVMQNEIWFVGGMYLAIANVKPIKPWISISLGVLFVILSIVFAKQNNGWISFLLGVMACVSVIEIIRAKTLDNKQNRVLAFLAGYTMPIFLMHTMFAASFRVVLLKAGIHSAVVHVVSGIAISIIGPIIAAKIMNKTKVLEFFLYPGKFVTKAKMRPTL